MIATGDDPGADVVDAVGVALRDRVLPMLKAHGGGVDVTAIEGGVLHLTWLGACVGCPLRPFTVAAVLEPAFADIEGVEEVDAGIRVSRAAREQLLKVRARRTAQ